MFKPLAFLASSVSVVLALVFSQTAFAATDIYSGLGQGFDISYPQCGAAYPAGSFGVIGIDHGRPFDVDNQYGPNPCLTSEYAAARTDGNGALYMNTGYANTYYNNHQVASCVSQSQKLPVSGTLQQAWEIGCATAYFNYEYALGTGPIGNQQGLGLPAPTMWWLDVETGNSWSSARLSLNAETLTGAVQELTQLDASIPVGVYSTSYQWGKIVGKNSVPGLAADWVATGQTSATNVTSYCSKSFTGAPVWLVQWVWQNTYDYDVAC